MSNLGVSIEANLDNLNNGISAAISKVQGFGKAVEGLPAPKLPTPQFNGAEISKVLDGLDAKLRVAQGNVELFGNQFQGDKLKILAYQQALNQLLAQGLSPTSKEVLNLANNIELLGKKTERQQAILERQASKAAQAFQPQEGILQNLQRNIDLYRQKMLRATDTKSIENYRQTIHNLETQVRTLGSTGPKAVNSVTTAANRLQGSAGAVNMEFARIIQDAPYGMMGIGNNIQQLTANFGQLAAQAGGTRAALGAALTSLVSPASLLTLGIAALTSGWAAYTMWQQKSAKSTSETAKELRKSKDSVEDYIKSLDSVSQARVNGERQAQRELTVLKLLYKQTQSNTSSKKEQGKAVEELQKQYPETFQNFTREEILAGKAAGAYEKLTTSILASARARAAQSLIAEKAQQQLVNEQKIVDLKRDQQRQEQEAARRAAAAAKRPTNGGTASGGAIAGQVDRDRIKQAEKLNDIIGERQKLELENIALGEQMLSLEATATQDLSATGSGKGKKTKETETALEALRRSFDQATKEAIVFGDSFNEMGTKADAFKTTIQRLLSEGMGPNDSKIKELADSFMFFGATTLPDTGTAIQRFIKQDLNALQEALVAAGAKPLPPVEIPTVPPPDFGAANTAWDDFMEGLTRHAIDMGDIAMNLGEMAASMVDNFSGAIAGIASELGSGAMQLSNFGDALLGALSELGKQAGAYFVKLGLPMLLSGNPLGGALIAAGLALSAFSGSLGSGGGGGSGGGSMAPSVSGTGGYTTYQPTTGTSYTGSNEIKFRIEGQDLVSVMDRANYKTTRVRG
jgi:hypothetical protein